MFACYTLLAQHFQSRRDGVTGVYFLEKCLEIARLTSDSLSEMLANHNLGLAFEQARALCMRVAGVRMCPCVCLRGEGGAWICSLPYATIAGAAACGVC